MLAQKGPRLSYKIWIEDNGRPILDKGGAEILEQIGKEKSISMAAKKLDMSYRYVWNYSQKIKKTVGGPVAKTFKGGKKGGGGADLTDLGKNLLSEYQRLEAYLGEVLGGETGLEVRKLKMSARNRLKGKVTHVEKNGLMAKIKVDITLPTTVTAIITKEAAEDLSVRVGDEVEAIVKSTEVMIAK